MTPAVLAQEVKQQDREVVRTASLEMSPKAVVSQPLLVLMAVRQIQLLHSFQPERIQLRSVLFALHTPSHPADNGRTPFPVVAYRHPVLLNAPPTSAAFAQCVPAVELPTRGPAVPAALFVG